MSYAKKVIVLKQVTEGYSSIGKAVSGILRTETESGVTELHLSLINLSTADTGTYQLFIVDGNKNIYSFDLGKRPNSFNFVLDCSPDFKTGLASGICLINSSIPVTVMFGRTDGFDFSCTDFKKVVAERCAIGRKERLKKEELDRSEKAQTPLFSYNDEAVATENYFELEEDIKNKLDTIKGIDNERLRTEDGLPCDRSQEKANQGKPSLDGFPNEEHFDGCKEYSEKQPYYLSVQQELEEIFLKFPEEECLPRYFFGSRWAKIHYSESKYYVVGVIKENDKEKYICYGVPSSYSPEPPKELKGYCTFIPISIFDMKGDGYWMMFQDAVSGNCVKPTR